LLKRTAKIETQQRLQTKQKGKEVLLQLKAKKDLANAEAENAAAATLPVPYGLILIPINPITPKVDISALKETRR
jgi:hypothetical protein